MIMKLARGNVIYLENNKWHLGQVRKERGLFGSLDQCPVFWEMSIWNWWLPHASQITCTVTTSAYVELFQVHLLHPSTDLQTFIITSKVTHHTKSKCPSS